MLHEAGMQFDAYGFDRVTFTVPDRPGRSVFDQCPNRPTPDSPLTLNLDLPRFVNRISVGAENWLQSIAADEVKQASLDRLLQYRPLGLPPHWIGMPLIA